MKKTKQLNDRLTVDVVEKDGKYSFTLTENPAARIAAKAFMRSLENSKAEVHFTINDEEISKTLAQVIIASHFKTLIPTLNNTLLMHIDDEPMEIDLTPFAGR